MDRGSVLKPTILAAAALAGIGAVQSAIAADAGSELWDSLFRGQVVLIGETHQKAESLELARRVVAEARAIHTCVALALEIPSDQQEMLGRVAKGTASVDEVFIWPTIDFPAYRVFLAEMLKASSEPDCFRVVAADLPGDMPGLRDSAMSASITEVISDGTTVVGLFGALHVTAGIRYRTVPAERNLADQLLAAKVQVSLLGEAWSSSCGEQLVDQASPLGRRYVRSLEGLINGQLLPGRNIDTVRVFCGPAGMK